MRYNADDVVTLRRGIMARGQTLATLLSEVLAGKHPALLDGLVHEWPGLRPDEVVRQALEQVERRRLLLDHDDDHYGRCDRCGVDLGLANLRETPWADRCRDHAAN